MAVFFKIAEDDGYHDDWYEDFGIDELMSRTERANQDRDSASYSGSESEGEDPMVAMYGAVRAHVDGVWGLPTQEVHAEERKFIAWTPRYRDYFDPLGTFDT